MNILINTDHNIQSNAALITKFTSVVKGALNRMEGNITRVQVHLSEENSEKNGKNNKRCMIEARLGGRHPLAVTDHAPTLNQALDGATDKLKNMIESINGRNNDQRNSKTIKPTPEPKISEEK